MPSSYNTPSPHHCLERSSPRLAQRRLFELRRRQTGGNRSCCNRCPYTRRAPRVGTDSGSKMAAAHPRFCIHPGSLHRSGASIGFSASMVADSLLVRVIPMVAYWPHCLAPCLVRLVAWHGAAGIYFCFLGPVVRGLGNACTARFRLPSPGQFLRIGLVTANVVITA